MPGVLQLEHHSAQWRGDRLTRFEAVLPMVRRIRAGGTLHQPERGECVSNRHAAATGCCSDGCAPVLNAVRYDMLPPARFKKVTPAASRRRVGVLVALCSLAACSGEYPDHSAEHRATARAKAEEQARADAEEQSQRAQAIAVIEDDRGEPPELLSPSEFRDLFAYYCRDCHVTTAITIDNFFQPDPELEPLLETEDLIEARWISPGMSATSRILERIRAGEMPPAFWRTDHLAPSPTGIQLIADYIDSLPPSAPPGE